MIARSLSLRWQLTLWYIGILAGALLLFGGIVYVLLDRELQDAEDDALQNLGLAVYDQVSLRDGQLHFEATADAFKDGERFVRLYDFEGATVFDNSAPIGSVSAPERWQIQSVERPRLETIQIDDQRFRVLSEPIRRKSKNVGLLQIAQSLHEADRTLKRLRLIMLAAVPATLLLASWGGGFLAGRVLSPIDRLTQTAQQIEAQDLSRRLGPTVRNDELGRLSATFDAMIARLEAAFERQRHFTADASHELRTPLTAMQGQIEVALSQERPAHLYRETLQTVFENVTRMRRLVNSLLLLARADSSTLALEWERLDFAGLAAAAAEQLEPVAAEQAIRLSVESTTPVPICGDHDRLLQVLLNLIDNAIKHTPTEGAVTVSCHATDSSAVLIVADTGSGIAPEHLARVFDRFYRADGGRARTRGGAGLGLAITHTLVEAHGGTIEVASAPGQGAIFTVRLPLAA